MMEIIFYCLVYLKNLTTPSAPTRTFLLCIKSARQYLYPAPAAPSATRPPVRRSHGRPLRLRGAGALELVPVQNQRLATGDREHTQSTCRIVHCMCGRACGIPYIVRLYVRYRMISRIPCNLIGAFEHMECGRFTTQHTNLQSVIHTVTYILCDIHQPISYELTMS